MGTLENDVIQYYNNDKIHTTGDLIVRVRESAPDTTVRIKLVRKGLVKEMAVKLEYDLYYIKHRTLAMDFQIILRTIGTMLRRTGR